MGAVASRASPLSIEKPGESGRRGASILETLKLLRSSGTNTSPKELPVCDEERSAVRHDEWQDLVEIPVLNLSLLQTDRAGVVKQIHKAVTEWGFFHILNHGIPLEVLHSTVAHGLKFFALPSEIKEKAIPQPGFTGRYTSDSSNMAGSTLHWAENLYFNSLSLERIVNQIWPDGNEEFWDTVTKYSSGVEKIAKQLHELIAESLGLRTDLFAQHYGTKGNTFRFNFCPACPTPTESMGIISHSDPSCLTLLLQDNVGGLQIQKDGQWLAIKTH